MLDWLSSKMIVRLWGLVFFCGAIYILIDGGYVGFFSTPVIVFGLIVGPGLIMHARWARIPALVFFSYWVLLGAILIFKGSGANSWLPILLGGIGGISSILRWDDEIILIEEAS